MDTDSVIVAWAKVEIDLDNGGIEKEKETGYWQTGEPKYY